VGRVTRFEGIIQASLEIAREQLKLVGPHRRATADGDDSVPLAGGLRLGGDGGSRHLGPASLDPRQRRGRGERLAEGVDGAGERSRP
jgi:hypothetical protein